MDHFPIFLNLQGRPALVVGGTEAAAQKAKLLLRADATLRVVAEHIGPEMTDVLGEPLVTVERRAFELADLDGVSIVIASSEDEGENMLVSNAAQARCLPVNVVDQTDLCSFIMPAFVDRSPILVAVSSGGASPVLARLVRARIEAALPQALGKLAALAQAFRQQVMRRLPASTRRRFWEDVLEGEVAERVFSNDIGTATRRLQANLDAEAASGKSTPVPAAPAAPAGAVWLVGAGPGDPDLLTAKALRLMQRCDVVLHDRLVAPAILDRVRRDAEFIPVGKAPGGAAWTQDQINALMIERARRGQCVLRLQGGDPTIFGRAGEEIEALRNAGIEPLIVPGVTAAAAAACQLGVSLTDRRTARSLVFANGPSLLDMTPAALAGLNAARVTIAVYMARPWLAEIREHLLAAGFLPETPTALVSDATREGRAATRMPLAALTERPVSGGGPTILIVGEPIGLNAPDALTERTSEEAGSTCVPALGELVQETGQAHHRLH